MHALRSACMQASWLPLYKCGAPGITYGHAMHEQYSSKKQLHILAP